jgi:hypothetical protein
MELLLRGQYKLYFIHELFRGNVVRLYNVCKEICISNSNLLNKTTEQTVLFVKLRREDGNY